MDRFISFEKGVDFIGRSKAERERAAPPGRRLAAFVVEANDADVHGYEPIWHDGAVAGFCTSGGLSHWTGQSIALGFLPREHIRDGLAVEIEILGKRRPARLITQAPFDADGARMRG